MDWQKIKSIIGKTWNFLWNDNSWQSWVVSIIVAFIFIKFIFLPGTGLVFGTKLPIVAVVSGSMEHGMIKDDYLGIPNMCGKTYSKEQFFLNFDTYWTECGDWYEEKGITKETFSKYSFKNGFNKGDIMFLHGIKPEKIEIGDTIVFQSRQRAEPIIHRVVKKTYTDGKYVFETKGDHNGMSGPVDLNISEEQIYGKAYLRLPLLGYVKVFAAEIYYKITGKQIPI